VKAVVADPQQTRGVRELCAAGALARRPPHTLDPECTRVQFRKSGGGTAPLSLSARREGAPYPWQMRWPRCPHVLRDELAHLLCARMCLAPRTMPLLPSQDSSSKRVSNLSSSMGSCACLSLLSKPISSATATLAQLSAYKYMHKTCTTHVRPTCHSCPSSACSPIGRR
jgi:hypothetical protein